MPKNTVARGAFRAAFPHTLPIMAGFLFLGMAYGIYMNLSGFAPIYPILMSVIVFSGTAQFIAVSLLLGAFDPVGAFVLMLMTGARHLFYGLAMLDKYKGTGWKKPYLIFAMCDETFSVNCTVDPPHGVDRGWFMFFISLLDQLYWVVGTVVGALFGTLVQFNAEGLDFAMTALILVLFVEQLRKDKSYLSSGIGLAAAALCLALFGADSFIVPAMAAILALLTLLRGIIEKGGAAQ